MIILRLLHTGIMGGEHYSHHGGGANYLCLPHKPKYDRYRNGVQGGAYIYGTEYQVSSFVGTVFKRNIHDYEAVCVVCFVKSRGSMLMMPARNDCPSGWTEEYHGYLMAERYNHPHSKDFICLDGDPNMFLVAKQTEMVLCFTLWRVNAARYLVFPTLKVES